MAVYVIYWKGPTLRERSPFAQQLNAARAGNDGRRLSYVPASGARRASRGGSTAGWGSRQNSFAGSRQNTESRQQVVA